MNYCVMRHAGLCVCYCVYVFVQCAVCVVRDLLCDAVWSVVVGLLNCVFVRLFSNVCDCAVCDLLCDVVCVLCWCVRLMC